MAKSSLVRAVGADDTALAVGSGDLEVLGTPVLIAWCEAATCEALNLPAEQTSVGTRVDISHRAPSVLGATITVTAEIREREGSLITFDVAAHDNERLIAEGTVTRAIVDRTRFLDRLQGVRP